jgi:hypothetical protein
VEEETGIHHTSLAQPLMTTYHVYDEFGKQILKETHWFNMKSPGIQMLIPQEAEQISASEWANEERMDHLLKNSYELVREILRPRH